MSTVEHHFVTKEDYIQLLNDARMQAASDEEEQFVKDMTIRFELYGKNAYLSIKQHDWLQKIAYGETQ